jgi:hypothetical protein
MCVYIYILCISWNNKRFSESKCTVQLWKLMHMKFTSGSRIYNCLPSSIKTLSNDSKSFKTTLKSYLIEKAFYSLDEYYQFQWLWFSFISCIYFIYLTYLIYLYYLFGSCIFSTITIHNTYHDVLVCICIVCIACIIFWLTYDKVSYKLW